MWALQLEGTASCAAENSRIGVSQSWLRASVLSKKDERRRGARVPTRTTRAIAPGGVERCHHADHGPRSVAVAAKRCIGPVGEEEAVAEAGEVEEPFACPSGGPGVSVNPPTHPWRWRTDHSCHGKEDVAGRDKRNPSKREAHQHCARPCADREGRYSNHKRIQRCGSCHARICARQRLVTRSSTFPEHVCVCVYVRAGSLRTG